MTSPPRAKPFVTQMRRGQLPASSCRHQHVDGHHRQSGRNAFPQRDHPIKHHVAGPQPTPGSWTEIRLGARAHKQTQHDTHSRRRGGGGATNLSQTPPLHHKHGRRP
jgi:hypothetical protein